MIGNSFKRRTLKFAKGTELDEASLNRELELADQNLALPQD